MIFSEPRSGPSTCRTDRQAKYRSCLRAVSSGGQSGRLITGWSKVRVLHGPFSALGRRAACPASYRPYVADAASFDRFAADYDRFARLERPTILEWLLKQLPASRSRALDAGCGTGRQTLALADRFDQVVGVDISHPLIDIARRRRLPPNVQYYVEDLMAFVDPDGFDLVFSSTTLHHLPELEAAL